MKEQGKNPPEQTNEEEIGSLPEKEFRVMLERWSKILEIEWRKYKNHLKGPRRIKEQTNNDEQHNKWN